MALPNSNISVSMVKQAIGSGSNDIGTLCTHPNINKWSKWKPIDSSLVTMNSVILENLKYGITVKSYPDAQAVMDAYLASDEVWEYNKPTGGSTSPYRLGDFRTYEHNALAPIAGGFVTPQASIQVGGDNVIEGSVLINGSPRIEEIGWEDLDLGGRRLMLVIRNRDGIVRAVAANEGETVVTANTRSPLPVLTTGIHFAYLMLTSAGGSTTVNLAGIPNHPTAGFPISIVSSNVRVTVTAKWGSANPNYLDYSIIGYNDTGSNVSLLNCVVKIRNSQNNENDLIQQYEQQITLGTLVCPPSTTGTVLHTESSRYVERSAYPAWKIFYRGTGTYPTNFEAAIIQEM